MKKLIVALVLVAGVSTLVYQSTQNAKLSKADRDQARVLVAALGSPTTVNTDTIDTSTKPTKPGCRNTLACNYDPEATEDEGTCNYAFYTLSTDSEELFTWWKQLTAKLEQGGKLSKTNQASVLLAAEAPPGANLPPVPAEGYQGLATELGVRNVSVLGKFPEVKLKPVKKCLAGTQCQLVSIVTWNAPASEIAPLSNITFTPFGYVAKKDDRRTPSDIKYIEGKKACVKPHEPPAPKKPVTPVNNTKSRVQNSKIKR